MRRAALAEARGRGLPPTIATNRTLGTRRVSFSDMRCGSLMGGADSALLRSCFLSQSLSGFLRFAIHAQLLSCSVALGDLRVRVLNESSSSQERSTGVPTSLPRRLQAR